MQQLNCVLSDGLWDLLQLRSKEANEPVSHIVNTALATHLGAVQHTLYQVSTSTALVEGIYQGAVRVRTLREHGTWDWARLKISMVRWRSSTAVFTRRAAMGLYGR